MFDCNPMTRNGMTRNGGRKLRGPWTVWLAVGLAVMGLGLVACGGGDDVQDGPATIKVGAIFDLTGPTSDVGTVFAEGIRGHFEWLEQNGGIDGRPVELLYQDYGYKVDRAEQLYSQFVQEGAVAFLGWGTGDTEALRGRIAEDQIPFTSASFSHVLGDPAEAPYNFLVGPSYSDQLIILLDWIVEHHEGDHAPSVALMHHPSPFGRSPYEQGGKDYADRVGVILETHEMPRGSTDYTAELTRIRESGAGYVIFQTTSGPVSVALRNARDLSMDFDFFCLNWCSNEVLTDLAGEAADGMIGSVSFSPPGEGVAGLADAEAFLASQGASLEAKGMVYGQGWTTAAIMMEGVRRVLARDQDVTGANIRAALESLEAFDTGGVTAPITYSDQSHLGPRGMRLFQVQGGQWQQLTDFRHAPEWEE